VTTIELAERYASLTFDELPSEVLERAKGFVLDTVGVAAGGVDLPSSTQLATWVVGLGGRAESSIIGGTRVPASQAALVNATIAHGLELDDVDNSSSLHPGVVVIPTALAVAEACGASGQEFLVAVVAGYDAIIRIGRAAGPVAQYERGFHPTATCGVFAAAVTASQLLRLDAGHTANAMGIAGSFAAGNLEYMANGAWTKRLQVGGAAQAGVMAAQLAAEGYTGPTTILEGESGFLRAHSGAPKLALLTQGLAEPYSILEVSVKPFACCRYCQTPIDAVLELVDTHEIDADDVTSIDVGMVSAGIPIVAEPRARKLAPTNPVDAQFSVYYAVAVALRRRGAFIDEFDEPTIHDPAVRDLLPLVHVHADPALDELYPEHWPSTVSITLTSGERFDLLAKSCRGDPDKPLSREELVQKFEALSRASLDPGTARAAADLIDGIDAEENVDGLMALLSDRGGSA
jgi:2-methylcitrate dehydratase PrpD